LGIGQITADEDAEQPTSKTRWPVGRRVQDDALVTLTRSPAPSTGTTPSTGAPPLPALGRCPSG